MDNVSISTGVMVTSTPRGIKRKSMINNITKTPLQLSVALSPLRGTLAQNFLTDKDDEEERRARRESIQKASTSRNSDSIHFNSSFVNKQYDRCKLLFMENKITIKNAWDVPIIDMLQEICNPNRPNFLREASISIDIGSKVYSLRVDYVHSEGMKLAKNMARITANTEGDQRDAEQEEEANNEPNRKKRKMKRRNGEGVKSTIAADPKTLLTSFTKLEPVDFMLRGDSESGQISGLFTRKLKEDNTTFLTLNKEKLLFPDGELPIENIPMKNVSLSLHCPFKFLGALKDFRMDHHQKDFGISSMSLVPSQQPLIFDDDGIPMHENDGPVVENFFEDNDISGNDVEMETVQPEYVTNFYKNFADATSEYTFKPTIVSSSGQAIDKLWAGPSHWKLKGMKRSTTRFTGAVTARNQRPKKGRKSDAGPIENFVFNLEVYPAKPGAKSKTVKKRKGVDPNKLLLPLPDPSLAQLVENYDTLHLKPGVKVSRLRKEQCQRTSDACDNHDNSNDGDYLQNNDFSNDHEEIQDMRHDQDYDAEDLVDIPTTVPIFALNFARRANYTNVKKLKDMVWKTLSGLDMDSSQGEQSAKPIEPMAFSEVYQAVTEKEKQKSPSPHVTFMAVLHLANEKGLQLDAEPDFKNFVIKPSQYRIEHSL